MLEIVGCQGRWRIDAAGTRAAAETSRYATAVIVPLLAVTVAEPGAMPVARPLASTEATLGSELDQVTAAVRSAVDPSV